ncbi:IS5 family transposase [Candidatus Poriferisodalis sp.]|uniref:IS5 family transposase n=1 Tax=Candidatus Poriferisodalis sp. TaxID=3101277 RepID=UPI003B51AB73
MPPLQKNTGERCMGRGRGGLTTKINAHVDGRGRALAFVLSPGQTHDVQAAAELLSLLGAGCTVLADKADDSNAVRAQIAKAGATANIPPKAHRRQRPPFDPVLYKQRNLIERFFNKLKHYRRIATRYEKTASNFLAFIKLATVRLWLRTYEYTT